MKTTKQTSKHTPGPWVVDMDANRLTGRIMAPQSAAWVADAHTFPCRYPRAMSKAEEWEGNARLIAAAPEMLEALHQCVIIANSAGGHGIIPGRITQIARAAIAKAEGRDEE